jgi:hypothetical protein
MLPRGPATATAASAQMPVPVVVAAALVAILGPAARSQAVARPAGQGRIPRTRARPASQAAPCPAARPRPARQQRAAAVADLRARKDLGMGPAWLPRMCRVPAALVSRGLRRPAPAALAFASATESVSVVAAAAAPAVAVSVAAAGMVAAAATQQPVQMQARSSGDAGHWPGRQWCVHCFRQATGLRFSSWA